MEFNTGDWRHDPLLHILGKWMYKKCEHDVNRQEDETKAAARPSLYAHSACICSQRLLTMQVAPSSQMYPTQKYDNIYSSLSNSDKMIKACVSY